MGGEGNGQPARSRMPHHDRPLPFQLADDRQDIAHIGIDRVVLARAPAGFAEAAFVVARDFAVGGERLGDADPIVGVEVVGAMHEQNGRLAARAEGAVENRYVAGIHPSVALHESRLPARSFLEVWGRYYTPTPASVRHPQGDVGGSTDACRCSTIRASSANPPCGRATNGLMSTDCTTSSSSAARRPSATSASTSASTSSAGVPR